VAAPRQTLERELKLDVDSNFTLPPLAGKPLESRVFTSAYFDTESGRLLRAGITLRRRVENGKGVWQLKLPRASGRLELESAGGPAAPPVELARLLVAVRRGQTLIPVGRMRTRRTGFCVEQEGRAVADVALDRVSVLDGRRVASTFCELEVELLDGVPTGALAPIGEMLRWAGARASDGRPKLRRVLDVEQSAPHPSSTDPPAAQVQAALAAHLQAALSHDPGVRLGDDPEDVHQLRVATRRLRAVLRAVRPLVPSERAEPLRGELGWLGSQLGPVRDLDVLIEGLTAAAGALTPDEHRAFRRLLRQFDAERAAAREALLDALASERYFALLDTLENAAAAPFVLSTDVRLPDLAAAAFAKLRKTARALGDEPSDAELHRVRIRGKRARYTAELAEAAAGKPATRFIAAAKTFQDVIGEHQDAVVAEQQLKKLAANSRGIGVFAAGRLAERERARQQATRKAFAKAWAKLERSGRRAWS
jgi:CHAD domain-containing protein